MKPRQHIVIIGGNFAGLTAAIKMSKRHAVTVIDPSAHFEWMPNIHEILSSVKTPQGLRLDRAAIVDQAGHRFLQDRVTELHPAERQPSCYALNKAPIAEYAFRVAALKKQ